MTLNNFIDYSKEHGKSSAKFLTSYNGSDIYIAISNPIGRFRGYPLLMKESKNTIISLSHDEITAVLQSLPDDE